MKAHIQINNFLNFLVFSFQNASEQNIDNGNTHNPPDSDPNFSILSACEVTKFTLIFLLKYKHLFMKQLKT